MTIASDLLQRHIQTLVEDNAQWQTLIADDLLWKDLIWKRESQYRPKQYRPIDNCPADNVPWCDAIVFCRWLSARLGFKVRLPHELEWQQAVTGGRKDFRYPWGPKWKEGLANTAESHLGRTTAVGFYPQGASPMGVLDLVGNVCEWCLVWEWCLSEDTSLRGGKFLWHGASWSDDQKTAHLSIRIDDPPFGRDNGIVGFRVVCLSPFAERGPYE